MPAHPTPDRRRRERGWVSWLAAPRWSVLFFVLTAAGALAVAHGLGSATALMVVPFTLLLINLLAAIISMPRFRADFALLLFHLALLALVALMVLARLIYFDGTTSLSRGTAFDGTLLTDSRGPLHRGDLNELRFSNEGFTADYFRQGKYRATYNRVSWVDANGLPRLAEVGDDRPLVIGRFRIYTTAFRGFSAVFEWQPDDGSASQMGAVQMTYAGHETFGQMAEWRLPNDEPVWMMLDFTAAESGSRVAPTDPAAAALQHALVLRMGEERQVMTPGDQIRRPGGTLVYQNLDSWMGYRIIYDPTEPWIIATVVVGILSLVWFYARRLFTRLPPETAQ